MYDRGIKKIVGNYAVNESKSCAGFWLLWFVAACLFNSRLSASHDELATEQQRPHKAGSREKSFEINTRKRLFSRSETARLQRADRKMPLLSPVTPRYAEPARPVSLTITSTTTSAVLWCSDDKGCGCFAFRFARSVWGLSTLDLAHS